MILSLDSLAINMIIRYYKDVISVMPIVIPTLYFFIPSRYLVNKMTSCNKNEHKINFIHIREKSILNIITERFTSERSILVEQVNNIIFHL